MATQRRQHILQQQNPPLPLENESAKQAEIEQNENVVQEEEQQKAEYTTANDAGDASQIKPSETRALEATDGEIEHASEAQAVVSELTEAITPA